MNELRITTSHGRIVDYRPEVEAGECRSCRARPRWWRLRTLSTGAPGEWICERCHPPLAELEAREERAAIIEYDAGFSRAEAEKKAGL